MRQFTKYPQRIVAAIESFDDASFEDLCETASYSSNPRTLHKIWKLYPNRIEIAEMLAKNPNTPAGIISEIYNKYPFVPEHQWKRFIVRMNLASNPNTPQDILMELFAADSSVADGVQPYAANNPNFPEDMLLEQLEHFSAGTRGYLARESKNYKVQQKLVNDPDFQVRFDLAMSDNVPDGILQQLANDPTTPIRTAVYDNELASEKTKSIAKSNGIDESFL